MTTIDHTRGMIRNRRLRDRCWWPTKRVGELEPRLVPASEWTQRVIANIIARHDTAENA